MNKTLQVENNKGNRSWIVVRQMPHDPQYIIGSWVAGLGKVVAIQDGGTATVVTSTHTR